MSTAGLSPPRGETTGWTLEPTPNDVGSDSKQHHKYILDIAFSMTLLLDFPQQQQVFYSSRREPKLLVSHFLPNTYIVRRDRHKSRRGGHKSRHGGVSQGMTGLGVSL